MRWFPPRKTTDIFKIAARINPLLPRLLPECGDLKSAQNELRWMKEHIASLSQPTCVERNHQNQTQAADSSSNALLEKYVRRRSRGEPLQYILGTQPFGDLEILCKPRVLIPRAETETYATMLGQTIKELENTNLFFDGKRNECFTLKIVDYCTGSGCIALLLHSILRANLQSAEEPTVRYRISGQDESLPALALAKENKDHNIDRGLLSPIAREEVQFSQVDVLGFARAVRKEIPELYPSVPNHRLIPSDQLHQEDRTLATFSRVRSRTQAANIEVQDIVVANPPYIRSSEFSSGGTVAFSVRQYEPRKALLPPPPTQQEAAILERHGSDRADIFYLALIDIAVASQAKLLIMEIGDNDQAQRVRSLVRQRMDQIYGITTSHVTVSIETWRDDGKKVVGDTFDDTKDGLEVRSANDRAIVVKFGLGWAKAQLYPDTPSKIRM